MRDLATDLTRGGAWPPLCDPTIFAHVCKVVGGLVLSKPPAINSRRRLINGGFASSGVVGRRAVSARAVRAAPAPACHGMLGGERRRWTFGREVVLVAAVSHEGVSFSQEVFAFANVFSE